MVFIQMRKLIERLDDSFKNVQLLNKGDLN